METYAADVSPPAPSPPPPLTQPLAPEKEFIITLETLPILWDKKNPHYVNKYKRNEALEKNLLIYKKIKPQATIEDVKKKINTLRSNYRRELKKVISSKRSGVGAEEVYIPKSWTFEYLHFLFKYEQPVSQTEFTDDTEERESESQGSTASQTNIGSISSIREVPPPLSRQPIKTKTSKQNELLERACAYLSEPTPSSLNSVAFDWAKTLERLDPTQRLYAKKAINDVLFEVELGNLNRYSVKINEPNYFQSPSYSNIRVSSATPSPSHSNIPVTSTPTSFRYSGTSVTSPPAPSKTEAPTILSYDIIPQSSSIQRGQASQVIITNPNIQQQTQRDVQFPTDSSPSYILHITSPQPHQDDSEDTGEYSEAGSLFAQFKP